MRVRRLARRLDGPRAAAERVERHPEGLSDDQQSDRFDVDDADRLYAFHQAHGVEIIEPIADRAYGLRDYAVRDLHGYALSFGHVI